MAKEPASANGGPFAAEIAAFENYDRQNSFAKDSVLFVGSSSIRLWQTADSFPDLPVINRGFGGSTIAHVNQYADRIVFKYKPRVIVFYSGDNDIAGGKSPDKVFADFSQFVDSVHERLPETQIIFLPVKPSIARWNVWPKMQTVNERVRDFTKNDKRLTYVDTATPMLGDDGKPRPELFRDDGLHLNNKGYALWDEVLCKRLNEATKRHSSD
jgi:lysophospholipase L1-like esterase